MQGAQANPANPGGLIIAQKYRDEGSLKNLLTRIGVTANARRKLINDDFTSMEQLVTNYSSDVDLFKGVNKTFGNGNRNTAIRSSPIVTKRLVLVLFHFVQAVGCIHCIPDMDNVDINACPELIEAYDTHQKRKDKSGDNESLIELPDLKGHSNLTTYRDKFISNLLNINGARNTPLLYVINEAMRPRVIRTTPLFEVEVIDLNDLEFYAASSIHHGPQFVEDNSKVWMLIKKSLLGHQPYHHIDEYE